MQTLEQLVESVTRQVGSLAETVATGATASLLIPQQQLPLVLGVSRKKAIELRHRADFPKPLDLDGDPLYRRDDIVQWINQLRLAKSAIGKSPTTRSR